MYVCVCVFVLPTFLFAIHQVYRVPYHQRSRTTKNHDNRTKRKKNGKKKQTWPLILPVCVVCLGLWKMLNTILILCFSLHGFLFILSCLLFISFSKKHHRSVSIHTYTYIHKYVCILYRKTRLCVCKLYPSLHTQTHRKFVNFVFIIVHFFYFLNSSRGWIPATIYTTTTTTGDKWSQTM